MEETSAYIEEKGIKAIFEDMMTEIMTNKPNDPVEYLVQHLQNVIEKRKDCDRDDSDCNSAQKVADVKPKQPLIFVLGGPGSGKGTQCACIVRDFGYMHFSAGDLLREEVKSSSERGKQIKQAMEKGELVPSEWTVELLKNAVNGSPDAKGYLIDGFPRCLKQGHMFEEAVRPCDIVLAFECSEEVMTKRILSRASAGSGRVDDNIETLKKRFASNTRDTLPVIEYYDSIGKVVKVNLERPVDEVHADITQILKKNFD